MEQIIDEFFKQVLTASTPEQLQKSIRVINTAGFALAFMSAEPEAVSEIVLNLKVAVKALTGVS
jgi:hypothetical protein